MPDNLELFRALEISHYANRYRQQVFVVAFNNLATFESCALDCLVLSQYALHCVVLVQSNAQELIDYTANRSSIITLPKKESRASINSIKAAWQQECLPAMATDNLLEEALAVSELLNARKLLVVSSEFNQLTGFFPLNLLQANALNIDNVALSLPETEALAFVQQHIEQVDFDFVLIDAQQGAIFTEIFTLGGAGLLISKERKEVIRFAKVADLSAITLLLAREVNAGNLLPISSSQIMAQLKDFLVYQVDGLLVGCVMLKHYPKWAELAKLAMLPRYRHKKRAQRLCDALLLEAHQRGYEGLFLLSTAPSRNNFFERIGYAPIERQALPLEWQNQYNFRRNSQAYFKSTAG